MNHHPSYPNKISIPSNHSTVAVSNSLQMPTSTGDDSIETERNDAKPAIHTRSACPLIDASIPQKIFFGWAWPLLKLGSQRPLQEVDLPDVHPKDSSRYNREYIDKIWTRAKNSDSQLGYALLKDYYATTRVPQCILFLNSAAKIGQAIALGLLMEQFSQDTSSSSSPQTGYFWCAVMVGCGLIAFPTKQRLYFEMYRKGMQVRAGLVALLYDKSIRLASSSSFKMSSGKLTNLASNDVERFLLASIPSLNLVLGPIEAIVILVVGICTMGPVFAVGHGLVLLLVPLQVYLGRRFVRFRSEVAQITDARVTLVSQAVSGARIMKMNGWEMEFQKRIATLRAKETAKLQAASYYKALNDAIYYFSSIVVSVAIFIVQVFVLGEPLTPRKVYTTLTLLNILHLTLTKLIPNAVMTLSECYVSSQRIQEFLELPENEPMASEIVLGTEEGPIISLQNASFDWEVSDIKTDGVVSTSTMALDSITLSFDAGNLYCIMGKGGYGKSALIRALAGDLHLRSGSIERNYTSLAYAAQDPWIMNGSIRDNIVMGKKWDTDWYQQVVDACGLRQDLQDFIYGDDTIVGDRGIQISGGQRARIGLARAFYRDAQVLLLDDPLSAIDSTLSRLIYQNAIQELGTKQGKCIIMATHEKQHVGPKDDCIILDGGSVAWNGPLDSEHSRLADEFRSSNPENTEIAFETKEKPVGKQMEEQKEKRGTGIVESTTWSAYGKALGGRAALLFLFMFFAITQSALLVLIVEVGNWAAASTDSQNTGYWLLVVLGMTAAVIVL